MTRRFAVRALTLAVGFAAGIGLACERPDSIALGDACTGSAECKDPADTCLDIAGKKRCTMACSAENHCPDGYVCPVTNEANRKVGHCLAAAQIGPNVVRVY